MSRSEPHAFVCPECLDIFELSPFLCQLGAPICKGVGWKSHEPVTMIRIRVRPEMLRNRRYYD